MNTEQLQHSMPQKHGLFQVYTVIVNTLYNSNSNAAAAADDDDTVDGFFIVDFKITKYSYI
jgi:hypothetical protein